MVDASTIGVIQALYGVGPNGGIPTALVTDKTLTLENRAADAKAAGDAIRAVTNTANTLSARANVLSGSVSGSSILRRILSPRLLSDCASAAKARRTARRSRLRPCRLSARVTAERLWSRCRTARMIRRR